MSDEDHPKILNTIADDTGADDPEFKQWRRFCAQNKLDVNLLVSQLSNEEYKKWNEFQSQEQAKEEAAR